MPEITFRENPVFEIEYNYLRTEPATSTSPGEPEDIEIIDVYCLGKMASTDQFHTFMKLYGDKAEEECWEDVKTHEHSAHI